MTDQPINLFWDSCLFCRYLIGNIPDFVEDIRDYLRDAKKGIYLIHYSTFAMAEVKPSHFKAGKYGGFQDFIDDWEGAFKPIEPSPQVMLDAAALRDIQPVHPTKTANRVIGMGDALQLASCMFASRVLGVQGLVFHTLDKTPGSIAGEKTVPIIGMEDWFDPTRRNRQLREACAISRIEPRHPQRRLPLAPPPKPPESPPISPRGQNGVNPSPSPEAKPIV